MLKLPLLVCASGVDPTRSEAICVVTTPRPTVVLLKRSDYPAVQYWKESDYSKQHNSGDTEVITRQHRLPGWLRHSESESINDVSISYPWLEDVDGEAMSQAQLDQASRVLFQACAVLKDANMALVSTTAYEYVHSELSGFVESWLCEDNWKAEQWITKRYALIRPLTDQA